MKVRAAYRAYVEKIERGIIENPNQFWNFVNLKRKCSGYPASMYLNNSTASSTHEICNLFATFFQSVYKKPDVNNPSATPIGSNQISSTIGIPAISTEDVSKCLLKMNPGCGIDGIPSSLLQKLLPSLAIPLTKLFNSSLKCGVFPEIWKKSVIIPIYKSGKRCDIKNYRGISKMSSIPKLFEMVVSEYLYFNIKSMLSHHQHGFMQHRSTTTNLLTLCNEVFDSYEKKHQVDVVFTDFAKAFDSPQFDILLHKLSEFGLSPCFIDWLESYLTERKQEVQISGVSSRSIDVHSGFPQGSHLGPILFNMFINDVVEIFRYSKCLMFADDLKLYKIISKPEHCAELQSDINALVEWSNRNKLFLNINKCKTMTFCRTSVRFTYPYSIGDTLEKVSLFKDLGVTLDEKLTFSSHIDNIVSKGNSMLGFLRRMSKDFRNPTTIRSLYCSLVRSNLEYASIIWNPAFGIDINRIERIQKQFIFYYFVKINWPFDRTLPMWQNVQSLPPYIERCNIAELTTLSTRRSTFASSFVADLLNSVIDCPELLSNIDITVPFKPRREQQFIYLPTFKSNYLHNAPFPSMCRQFNSSYNLFDFNLSKFSFENKLKNIL